MPDTRVDHTQVRRGALTGLRWKMGSSRGADACRAAGCTLAGLRAVHGGGVGRGLDRASLRRRALATGAVEASGHRLQGTRHRPPSLYRYRAESVATSPTPPPRSAS